MKCFPTLQELQVFSVILVDYTSVQVKIGQNRVNCCHNGDMKKRPDPGTQFL